MEHSSCSTILHLLLFICWLHRVTSPPEGRGALTNVYRNLPAHSRQHQCESARVGVALCLHAVREDWGCPVPPPQSPEVADHMCSHYLRLRLQLSPPDSTNYHTFAGEPSGRYTQDIGGQVQVRQMEGSHMFGLWWTTDALLSPCSDTE